jgi:hypothetical protein
MKKFLLTLSALLILMCSYAQKNFLSGYIVTNQKDTLRGYIDYRNWKRNPGQIVFGKNNDQTGAAFGPNDIAAFSVADEIYESATVEIEVSPTKISDLSYESEFKIQEETAFLQSLVRGKKSLYYLSNRAGIDNFYIHTGTKYELLLYKKYAKTENFTKHAIESKVYTGQLLNYLSDCPGIKSKIIMKRYLQKDLTNLFEFYYKCTNNTADFNKKADRMTVELTALAGITITNLNISGRSYPYLTHGDFETAVSPTGGLSLNLVLPRNQGRFSINNELLFTTFKIEGTHKDYESEDIHTYTYTTFETSQVKLNTMVRMKIPINKINLRLEAGVSNAYAFSVSADRVQDIKFYTQEEIVKDQALKNKRKYEQGFLGGIGAEYGKFSFTTRFEKSNGMSQLSTLKTGVTRIYLVFGFKLK